MSGQPSAISATNHFTIPRQSLIPLTGAILRPDFNTNALVSSKPKQQTTTAVASLRSGASTMTTANDVLWFVPNLIGYLRVAMALLAFGLMAKSGEDYWLVAVLLYIGSFVGDLFDGWAARKLDQCSVMGGLLDMITDRCATLGFLYILSGDYAVKDAELGFPAYRLVSFVYLLYHFCLERMACGSST